MPLFRVIDCRPSAEGAEHLIDTRSPELAGERATGLRLYRSGQKRDLIARVYWKSADDINMVRLYAKTVLN